MKITHHLEDATLMAYAAGTLPEAFNLIVAAHISLCDDCRATVEACDALGGAVMDSGQAVAMGAGSLDAALARLDAPRSPRKPQPRVAQGILPSPVRDYIGGDLSEVKWRPVGMGVKQAILPTSKRAKARLLCIPANGAMPPHSHNGTEMTLVLQGAFRDEEGRFGRGDIDIADQNVTHTPIAEPGEDCICLIVTEAPLRFQNWLPRIVQRFVGI